MDKNKPMVIKIILPTLVNFIILLEMCGKGSEMIDCVNLGNVGARAEVHPVVALLPRCYTEGTLGPFDDVCVCVGRALHVTHAAKIIL